MEKTIIEQVFFRNLITTIIIFAAIIAIFFFVRWAIKNDTFPKWSYAVYFSLVFAIVLVLGIGLFRIHLDITNKDYIIYHGEYIERGGGQSELKTVVVYDESGKEVKLLRTGPSETGIYSGIVVYGKRSKIVVEYSGTQKHN